MTTFKRIYGATILINPIVFYAYYVPSSQVTNQAYLINFAIIVFHNKRLY